MAAVMLVSCKGNTDEGGENGGSITAKKLVVEVDKKFVQTFGGDYITLSVTLGDEPVTEGVVFYDEKDNELPVEDFKFMTDEAGVHRICAGYGTYFSDLVAVTAIDMEIPETPDDSSPSGTDFKQKVLLTQFTTTGCTYCPSMKIVLKDALNEAYAEKVVKVDCHTSTMNRNDPAFVYMPEFEEQCDALLPSVNLDMYATSGYLPGWGTSGAAIRSMIDERYDFKEGKAAGIAVNSVATDNQIIAKVAVKAAEAGSYRVGLMLLEDNIVATSSQTQQGSGAADWMNTHNSIVRYMDAKYTSGSGYLYYGHDLGEIAKGAIEEYVFILDLESIWENGMLKAEQNGCTWADRWVSENLHLAVFATTVASGNKGDFYYVSNVVDCPINASTPFQYK